MQRSAFFVFCSIFISMLGLAACQHDPFVSPIDPGNPATTDPPATGACNPDSVYFQNQILPILVSNCTESGCHNALDRQNGVVLDSYLNLVGTVENATQNDFHENKLMRSILSLEIEDRMPPEPKFSLPQAQIDLLQKWLAQGAQNNACDENFGGCDTANVKFSAFVQPLVHAKCQGCHSGNTPQGSVKLTSHAEIQTVALNGRLYASLTRSTNWMPNGGTKLEDCSLKKNQAWIQAGAPAN